MILLKKMSPKLSIRGYVKLQPKKTCNTDTHNQYRPLIYVTVIQTITSYRHTRFYGKLVKQ